MPKRTAEPHFHRKIMQYTVDSAATFKDGAAVLLASDEEIEECGADPAAILGFAAEEATKDPETGKVLVHVADELCTFWMEGDNDPVAGDLNQTYGIAKDADGIWYVDGTDTTNTRVYVHDIDIPRKLYRVSVLAANRQAAP